MHATQKMCYNRGGFGRIVNRRCITSEVKPRIAGIEAIPLREGTSGRKSEASALE